MSLSGMQLRPSSESRILKGSCRPKSHVLACHTFDDRLLHYLIYQKPYRDCGSIVKYIFASFRLYIITACSNNLSNAFRLRGPGEGGCCCNQEAPCRVSAPMPIYTPSPHNIRMGLLQNRFRKDSEVCFTHPSLWKASFLFAPKRLAVSLPGVSVGDRDPMVRLPDAISKTFLKISFSASRTSVGISY